MMLRRAIAATRYLILPAVVCLFLIATAVCAYGVAYTVRIVRGLFRDGVGAAVSKSLILDSLVVVDLLLLAITIYLIALGLYELFIDPDLPTPAWLVIRDIDDLKAKVIGVVVVILALLFLSQALLWDGTRDLLRFGASVALIIASLTYFLGQKSGWGGGKAG